MNFLSPKQVRQIQYDLILCDLFDLLVLYTVKIFLRFTFQIKRVKRVTLVTARTELN